MSTANISQIIRHDRNGRDIGYKLLLYKKSVTGLTIGDEIGDHVGPSPVHSELWHLAKLTYTQSFISGSK